MKYYSFKDIMSAYRISKETLKNMCQNGKIKCQKLPIGNNIYKYIIPETELPALEHLKFAEIQYNPTSQPDYSEKQKALQQAKSNLWLNLSAEEGNWERFTHKLIADTLWHAFKFVREEIIGLFGYAQYLKSDTYKIKRAECLKRDNFQCQKCGTGKNLVVHHINYTKMGTNEELDDLITLCQSCHHEIHYNDIKKQEENNKNNDTAAE